MFSDKIIASDAERKRQENDWDSGQIQPKLILPMQNPEDYLSKTSNKSQQKTILLGMTNDQRHQAEREFEDPTITEKVRQNERLFA